MPTFILWRFLSWIEKNCLKTLRIHDSVFGYDVDAVQDNNYMYLFNADNKSLEAIAMMDVENAPILGEVTSKENAINIAKHFVTKATNGFSVDNCDAFCSVVDNGNTQTFSIELWEKIADNFYTGNKVAVVLDSNGVLQSYVANTEVTSNNVTASAQKHKALCVLHKVIERLSFCIDNHGQKVVLYVRLFSSNSCLRRSSSTQLLRDYA